MQDTVALAARGRVRDDPDKEGAISFWKGFRSRAPFWSWCLVISACIPTRDNPNDPSVAPRADLDVVDLGRDAAGACRAPQETGNSAVAFASRGACLALDASSSRDPQRRSLEYEFHYAGTDGDEAVPARDGAAIDAESAYLVISTSLLLTLDAVPTVLHSFSVTVTDKQGYKDRASIEVALSNGRPVPRTDPDRALPVGGYPWALGASIPVTFHAGESTDPDADRLHYCWTIDGVAFACSTENDVTVSIDPANERRVVGELRVHDNEPAAAIGAAHFVERALAVVDVRDQNAWVADDVAPSILGRVVPIPFLNGAALDDRTVDFGLLDGNSPRFALADQQSLSATSWPSTTGTLSAPLPAGFSRVSADAAHDRVWSITTPDASDFSSPFAEEVRLWSFAGAPPAVPASVQLTLSAAIPVFDGTRRLLDAVDASGCLWITHLYAHQLARVCSDGAVSLATASVGFAFVGLSTRDGTDQAWVVEAPDPGSPSGGARLVRLDDGPTGIVRTLEIDLGDAVAYGPAFISDEEAWLSLASQGVVRVDIESLESGIGIDGSILAIGGGELVPSVLLLDPRTREVWVFPEPVLEPAVGNQPAYARVSFDGATEVFHGWVEPQLVDPAGTLWYTELREFNYSNHVKRTAGPGENESLALRLDRSSQSLASSDLSDGSLWLYERAPGIPQAPTLSQYASDGRRARFEDSVASTLGTSLLPSFGWFTTSPEGRTGWGVTDAADLDPFVLFALDLTGDRATISSTLAPNQPPALLLASSFNLVEEPLFAASSPASPEPFVWTMLLTDSSTVPGAFRVVAVDADGDLHERYTFLAGELQGFPSMAPGDEPLAARALGSNRLCLHTQTGGGFGSLYFVNPPPDPIAFQFAGSTFDPVMKPAAIAAATDPTVGDICMIGYDDACATGAAAIELWVCNAGCQALVPRNTFPGFRILSIAAENQFDRWILLESCTDGSQRAVNRSSTSFGDTFLPVFEDTFERIVVP